MSTENDDHDGEWDDRSDLTRLEDLSEFLHEEDPDVEAKLKAASNSLEEEEKTLPDIPTDSFDNEEEDLVGLGDLEDDEQSFDSSSDEESSFSEDKTDPNFTMDTENFEDNGEEDNSPPDFGSEEQSFDTAESDFGGDLSQEFDSEDDEDDFTTESFGGADESSSFETTEEDFQADFGAEDTSEEESADDETQEEDGYSEEQSFDSGDTDYGSDSESYERSFEGNLEEEEDQYSEESAENFALPDPAELENRPPIEAPRMTGPVGPAQPRENFQDLRDFGNAITYGVVTTGGNPPYSLILRNVKFEEDAEDIKIVLREHGLLSDDNEETITQGLEQGSLLISQISEYSAIYLAHKLRRFDVELRIGLSDQLHPSKSYTREGKGLVSKYNLRQNHRESLVTSEAEVDVHDIKMTTTPTLDGYNIHRYIDVVTAHTLIEEEELKRLHNINQSMEDTEDTEVLLEELLDQFPKEELESPMEQFDLGLNEIYKELVVELRNEAFKVEANAVVGINFNITPLIFRSGNDTSVHYKITCSGNAVWVIDQQ